MGASPYWYFVPYQPDVQAALDALRQREFEAGRYFPVVHPMIDGLHFGAPDFAARRPGCRHASIEDAMEEAAEEGTQSILDLATIGDRPDYCVAARVPDALLVDTMGTAKPSRAQIEQHLSALLSPIGRGQGSYVVAHENGKPSEIWFAGYSFD